MVHNGRKSLWHSTISWQIRCQWKDGSASWEKLSNLKESQPIETAEYAVAQDIDHEAAFNCWVPYVLKKRERIISLVKQGQVRYYKCTHKFGIELPTSVNDAYALNKKNSNRFWANAR